MLFLLSLGFCLNTIFLELKGFLGKVVNGVSFNIEELIEASDYDLFNKVRNHIHCLSSLLPPSNTANYMFNLRPRGHFLS